MLRSFQPQVAGRQVVPVIGEGDAQRHAEASRTAGEVGIHLGGRATLSCGLDPVDDLAGAHQDGRGRSLRRADHVGAHVHPVGEVGVQVPGRAEHHRVATGLPAEGVRAGVDLAEVRLDLGEAHRHTSPMDERPEQERGHLDRWG
jgi:hypothetical protein